LVAGQGTTEWFEDRPLDPRASYTATPDFRDEDNNPLPAVTKKLTATRLPLAAESRDRQVEIRFAVPAGSGKRYAVKLYVAPEGSTFAQDPTLTLPWYAVQAAYENEDAVFADITPTSPKANEPYVLRKIKRVAVAGVPELKEQAAFALETVLGGYHRYRVSLVEEGAEGRELNRVEGQAAPDMAWGGMLDDLTAVGQRIAGFRTDGRVHLARNGGMPLFQVSPYQVFGPQAGLVARVTMPIKRALGLARDVVGNVIAPSLPFQLVRGLVNGFIDGFEGDKQLILHPIDSFHAMKNGIAEFVKVFTSGELVDGWVTGIFAALPLAMGSKVTVLEFLDGANRFIGTIGYIEGYVVGMVLWQVASALVLAGAAAGVAAVVEKIAVVVRSSTLAVAVTARVARYLSVLGRVASIMARQIKAGQAAEDIARVAKAIFELADGPLAAVAAKYGDAMKTLEPALQRLAVVATHGKQVVEVFAKIAALPDEAAARILVYLGRGEGTTAKVADWIARYNKRTLHETGIENNRALREALAAALTFPTA
jgi:hypothetical protein